MAQKKKSTSTTTKAKKPKAVETVKEEIKEDEMASLDDTKVVVIPPKEEKKKEVKEDKVLNIKEVKEEVKQEEKHHHKASPITFVFALLTVIIGTCFFIFHLIDNTSTPLVIINSVMLMLFAIVFFVLCITTHRRHTGIFNIGAILLIGFFITNILLSYNGEISIVSNKQNFTGKSLTDVVKWAKDNNIKINQEYEYSDMIPEYEIISQKIEYAENNKDIESITVAVSEGPNPYKEVIIPSMLTWDAERVINFVKTNYLSNVIVEFIESDKVKDTVIEQSKSGNLLRNEELKLTFSYGDEGNPEEVSLDNFTNVSKFEIEFFMKQHHLNYHFEEDYSDEIKKGYGVKQSIEAGQRVKVNGDKILITISKGPKIIIPNLNDKSITELTEWAIENRLKLEFIDQYDEAIQSGKVISADVKEGDIVEQGKTIKVYVSLGKLTMQKFKTAEDFYKWADKYEIKYTVEHQFSDSVEAGQVISYSYKNGQTIKNDEAIVVVISDGKKKGVPNLYGMSKSAAANALEEAGLNYNFIYKSSNSSKNTVIDQSMEPGSEVSQGTTVTVTLSSGSSSGSGGNNNSGGNNGGGNNGGGSDPTPTPTHEPDPTPTCSDTVFIYPELIDKGNPSGTCSKIKDKYSSLKFNCEYVSFDGTYGGRVQNSDSIDGQTFTTCDPITIKIVNNNNN